MLPIRQSQTHYVDMITANNIFSERTHLPKMATPTVENELDVCLDIIGQQPGLNMYTQLSLCYSLPSSYSHSKIIDTLQNGLERLSTSFPWVAGQIVNEGSSEGNSGMFKIKPLKNIPILEVKDLRDNQSIPTMEAMRQANFPFTMLDESVVAPRNTRPASPEELATDSIPVFLLQATFIVGGLVLTFLAQHQAMDMAGQGQIMKLLSSACRNENFASEDLLSGNLPRRDIIPVLDESYQPGPELKDQIVTPTSPLQQSPNSSNIHPASISTKTSSAYFAFSSESLSALKSVATATIHNTSEYISTDDALSAFMWKSVSRVRLHRLPPTDSSTFARAVDARRYLGIPQTYPGIIHNMTYHTYTLTQLDEQPLGAIASQLRSAVDPKTSKLAYNTRALATFLDRAPDKDVFSFTATLGTSSDIMLSSWSKEICYDLDFGLGLGKPEAVRRPRFAPKITLIYFMPKSLNGEVAVGIFSREEDIEKLRADEELMSYAKYIG
jgi:hypothetical protein